VLSIVRRVPWASVLTIAAAAVFTLVTLFAALRGRVWAWIPFALAAAILVREIRHVQRSRRRHVGFEEPDRRDPGT